MFGAGDRDEIPHTRPGLIVMCGLPFAGKSTLARAIAAHTGARLVEIDAIVVRPPGHGSGPLPDAAWSAAYRAGEALVVEGLAAGERVVWDAVAFRAAMRTRLRRLAERAGTTALVVHVTTDEATIAARRARNRVAPTRHDVDDATFETVRARFQPPTADEWVVRYDGTEPVEPWLRRVFGG